MERGLPRSSTSTDLESTNGRHVDRRSPEYGDFAGFRSRAQSDDHEFSSTYQSGWGPARGRLPTDSRLGCSPTILRNRRALGVWRSGPTAIRLASATKTYDGEVAYVHCPPHNTLPGFHRATSMRVGRYRRSGGSHQDLRASGTAGGGQGVGTPRGGGGGQNVARRRDVLGILPMMMNEKTTADEPRRISGSSFTAALTTVRKAARNALVS